MSIHIGLNAVDPTQYEGWHGELGACENDANDMADIAKSEKIQEKLLLTNDATRAEVIQVIRDAAAVLNPGDFLMVSYSGHGGQVPDLDDEEPDGMDETWCLYDGQLLDDELAACWAVFKAGVRILVFSDSCHSGSVVRAMAYRALESTGALRAVLDLDGQSVARFREMPRNVAMRTYRAHRSFYDGLQAKVKEHVVSASVLLISGCQDNQLSQDGAFNGAFTGSLLRVWKHGTFQGGYREFHRSIVMTMPPTQVPNYFWIGAPNPEFEAQRPFTV